MGDVSLAGKSWVKPRAPAAHIMTPGHTPFLPQPTGVSTWSEACSTTGQLAPQEPLSLPESPPCFLPGLDRSTHIPDPHTQSYRFSVRASLPQSRWPKRAPLPMGLANVQNLRRERHVGYSSSDENWNVPY